MDVGDNQSGLENFEHDKVWHVSNTVNSDKDIF